MENLIRDVLALGAPATQYTLNAFAVWCNTLVQIEHPAKDSRWKVRSDCGSYAQLRWSLFNDDEEVVQLVVKHNTCKKALFNQTTCRSCQNPKWRQSCGTPENVYYLLPLSDIHVCEAALKPLMSGCICVNDDIAEVYQASKPRAFNCAKQPRGSAHKRRLIDMLRNDITSDLIGENRTAINDDLLLALDEKATKLGKITADDTENTEIVPTWRWATDIVLEK